MDSDDISYRTRIEEQVKFLEENADVDICSVQVKLFGDIKPELTQHPIEVTQEAFIKNFIIIHPFIMFRRELNIKYPSYKPAEDWIVFLELLQNGCKIENINKVLGSYRVNKKSLMRMYPLYCSYLISKIRVYYYGIYFGKRLSFHNEVLNKKTFKLQEIIEFIRYTKEIARLQGGFGIDVYDQFNIYLKYMIDKSNINKNIKYLKRLFIGK